MRLSGHSGSPRAICVPLPQIADQPEVTCPRCGATVNVARNRQRAVMDRDLLDAARLIEVMHTLGEPVCKERISAWLKASRLTTRRYVHAGRGLVERGQKVQRKRT